MIDSDPEMLITTSGASFDRLWQIRVDQIPCGAAWAPPSGCAQYHTGLSGNVRSFNYGTSDDYHHLADQYYSICVRKEIINLCAFILKNDTLQEGAGVLQDRLPPQQ